MTDLFKTKLAESDGRRIFADYLTKTFDNDALIDRFDALTALYFEVNSVINISALRNIDDVYVKHYLDSVYPYKYFRGECCDVGCGGGFPCLPLALVTDNNFIGIDGVGKKLTLINKCKIELGISNITALHARSEDIIRQNKTFDTVCARAVADTDKLISLCAPQLKPDARLILYKTQNDAPATQRIADKFGVKLTDSIDYRLPNTEVNRRLFIYTKSRL